MKNLVKTSIVLLLLGGVALAFDVAELRQAVRDRLASIGEARDRALVKERRALTKLAESLGRVLAAGPDEARAAGFLPRAAAWLDRSRTTDPGVLALADAIRDELHLRVSGLLEEARRVANFLERRRCSGCRSCATAPTSG